MEEILYKFIKFAIVGFSGLLLDFGVTFLLKEKIKLNRYIAHSLGFIVAVINNYFLNKYWTFQDNVQNVLVQGGKFLIIATLGLIISNQIIYFLNSKRKANFYVSKIAAIGIVVLWNFFANFYFTFSPRGI